MASLPTFSDAQILAARPAKNEVDPWRSYGALVEPERARSGQVEQVATLLLTNRECSFRCLMCDLWKNTTDLPVPRGAVAGQVREGLQRLGIDTADPVGSGVPHVKLYNSGNFFDPKAISLDDREEIASLVQEFQTVIVENHPRLCGQQVIDFQDRLAHQLEVAIGLETAHEGILAQLNKQMTLDDFLRATQLLRENNIQVRSFILLKPPTLEEPEAISWAVKSVEFSLDAGADFCALIPLRAGNGMIEKLIDQGLHSAPTLGCLELALAECLALGRGRICVDLWDIERLVQCPACGPARIARLEQMNLQQEFLPLVDCPLGCEGK
jgi:radical SAM enzyme (TIGR01210 family)